MTIGFISRETNKFYHSRKLFNKCSLRSMLLAPAEWTNSQRDGGRMNGSKLTNYFAHTFNVKRLSRSRKSFFMALTGNDEKRLSTSESSSHADPFVWRKARSRWNVTHAWITWKLFHQCVKFQKVVKLKLSTFRSWLLFANCNVLSASRQKRLSLSVRKIVQESSRSKWGKVSAIALSETFNFLFGTFSDDLEFPLFMIK